jgi:hypothetical protein
VNHFVNACILSCKASFDVLIYHTLSVWFFFLNLRVAFSKKIENDSIFYKWKYDKWKYNAWTLHERCNCMNDVITMALGKR